jgi:predicted transcriptional regulator
MTLTITVDPDLAAFIQDRAEARGQDVSTFATALLRVAVSLEDDYATGGFADENDDPIPPEEAAFYREGIQRGLSDREAGRVKPLAQVVLDARERFSLPPTWGAHLTGEQNAES